MIKYLLILLTLSGCVLLNGTPTMEPSPDPTPTQEVIDTEPLNDNYSFDISQEFGHITRIDNRTVFVPFSWLVAWYPNEQISDPNPHPDVFSRDGAVRFEVSNRGGKFGLAAHINTCAGCRYIIVAEYIADLQVMQGAFLNSRDLYGFCRFDNLGGDRIVSKSWRVLMQASQEFICVFETIEARTVRFDALVNITWQVLEGHVDFLEVRAELVSPDEFEDSVVTLP